MVTTVHWSPRNPPQKMDSRLYHDRAKTVDLERPLLLINKPSDTWTITLHAVDDTCHPLRPRQQFSLRSSFGLRDTSSLELVGVYVAGSLSTVVYSLRRTHPLLSYWR